MLVNEAIFLLRGLTWMPALLFIAGFILVTIEVLNPGFGAPGISGILLLILGIVFAAETLVQALILFALVVLIFLIMLFFVLKSASKGKLGKKLVLRDSLNEESGYRGRDDLTDYLGKKGIANTILRPSGTGTFEGVRLDIVTEGEFIPKDSPIVVVKVEGMRVVVKEIEKV